MEEAYVARRDRGALCGFGDCGGRNGCNGVTDMDVERELEQQAGRKITEMSIDGNEGFKAPVFADMVLRLASGMELRSGGVGADLR